MGEGWGHKQEGQPRVAGAALDAGKGELVVQNHGGGVFSLFNHLMGCVPFQALALWVTKAHLAPALMAHLFSGALRVDTSHRRSASLSRLPKDGYQSQTRSWQDGRGGGDF